MNLIQPENAEELINILDGQEVNIQNIQLEQENEAEVIVMDDLTDASDNESKPPLLPVKLVQIVPFPNFENLEPLIPEEVDYNDLLGYVNPPDNVDPAPVHQENIHIGFAQIYQPAAASMFSSWINPTPVFKPSPEALRQWVRHFSNSNDNAPSVIILDVWINFFTYILLQSPSFDWAKHFLQSPASDYFSNTPQVIQPFSICQVPVLLVLFRPVHPLLS